MQTGSINQTNTSSILLRKINPRPQLPNLINRQSRSRKRILRFPQHHQIRIRPTVQRPLNPLQSQHLRRRSSNSTKRLRRGRVRPPPEVIHTLDQRSGAPGNLIRAFKRQPCTGLDDSFSVSPLVHTVRKTAELHCVRNENHAVRMGVVRDLDRSRVQVDPVSDKPVVRSRPLALAQETEDTRVTVVEGTHGVEKMGDHSRAVLGG